MRKCGHFFAVLAALFFSFQSFAQGVTITGNVHSSSGNNEAVPSVSVTVKGTGLGVFTDANGNFRITVPKLPVTLVFTSIGYQSQEVNVSSASTPVDVSFVGTTSLGQEVVIAATRTPLRILESPVSIERVNLSNIRGAGSPDYYEIIKNQKGVDLTISSLTFKTVSTRGFNGSGNLRFNQLVDGMDNQAPGLNFSVGNVVGPTELDVESIELLQGASSALYGSGGTNGTMLINSKNPFKYQGFSFQIKQGMNHIHDPNNRSVSPYYDWSLRWAKTIGQRFAFKVSAQMINAQDWEANDTRNTLNNNVFKPLTTGNRTSDPNYDGVNVYGDEVSTSMASFAQAVAAQVGVTGVTAINNLAASGLTFQQIVTALSGSPTTAPLVPAVPFVLGLRNNLYGGQFISRTGYNEKYLVDYNAYDVKLTGAIHYKITNDIEASLNANFGTGTTVYTGADRYALKNLRMGQYKAEIKGNNWFFRAYTTQERSGDSYTATTAAIFIDRVWSSDQTWFQNYVGTYSAARFQGALDAQAHAAARSAADAGRLMPGTAGFNNAFQAAINTNINNGGAKFNDATNLYHFEGQYAFKNIQVVDLLVGASYRVYHLNSHGTIFADTSAPININEAGAYVQLQKSFLNDVLRLTGTVRYDKQSNFDGRLTPRATALIKVAPNNSIRLSYQTAYRFPSAQDQYINLLTGGANRLIGGLASFNTYFNFNTNPAYTAQSIVAYRASISTGTPNPTLLQVAQFQNIKPERANSYEVGYRGLITPKFLVDAYGYYCVYKDFIGRVAVGRGVSGNPSNAPVDLASPYTTNNISFVVNTSNFSKAFGTNTIVTDQVKAIGWGVSANYQLQKGYHLAANLSSDQLNNVPTGVITQFNTPKYRFNLGFGNDNAIHGFGFDVEWRWQDTMNWEGTFASGEVPAFSTIDAQASYKFKSSKSMIKLGASNVLNHYYISALGNPMIGGLYYLSYSYNL